MQIWIAEIRKDNMGAIAKQGPIEWTKFIDICSKPKDIGVSQAVFSKMTDREKDKIKNQGGFIGAKFKGTRRKRDDVVSRNIVVLDLDKCAATDTIESIAERFDIACFIYSTAKHTSKRPKFRLVIPLNRDVEPVEFEPIARRIAEKYNLLKLIDKTTFDLARLMYWPACPIDGEIKTFVCDKPFVRADDVLSSYEDWRQIDQWPGVIEERKTAIAKAEDPWMKKGVIGAICRAFHDIHSFLEDERFIPGFYIPSNDENRYTWHKSSGSTPGAVIYNDGRFLYSNHESDPVWGTACNVFDLIRVHKFDGDTDEAITYFRAQPEVTAQMVEDLNDSWEEQFEKDKEFPFIVETQRSVNVDPTALAEYFRIHNDMLITRGISGRQIYWLYDEGIYQVKSDKAIKGILDEYVRKATPKLVKSSHSSEAFRQIEGYGSGYNLFVEDSDFNAERNIIVFENGVLNTDTMELLEHSPKYRATIKIPVEYNSDLKSCPEFESYLETLTDGCAETQQLLLEFIGLTISNIPGYFTKKALFLEGPGNTGKSKYRELICLLLGEANTATIGINNLNDRFIGSRMHNKRLVGHGDCEFVESASLGRFKLITGGDTIDAEYKGIDAFDFVYRGTVLFCTNEMPGISGDRGEHVFERIMLVKCKNVIPEELRDPRLLDKMYKERSAIVNKAIEALQALVKRDYSFTEAEEIKVNRVKYRSQTSSILMFIEEQNVVLIDADKPKKDWLKRSELYQHYVDYCRSEGLKPFGRKKALVEFAHAFGPEYELAMYSGDARINLTLDVPFD